MKLSPEATKAVEQRLDQIEAQALPDDDPVVAELKRLFGEHTYFLDNVGLHIVEPRRATDSGKSTGVVVKLASRTNAGRTSLASHPPEVTDVIVVLEAA
jgi:hypothetical protein